MSARRFLIDESSSPVIRDGLRRRAPDVEVLCMGEGHAPALGTSDPEILAWLEANGYCLVMDNRSTMEVHLADHLMAGGHVPGIFVRRRRSPLGLLIESLLLIMGAAEPDEYADQVTHIPLQPTGRWPGSG